MAEDNIEEITTFIVHDGENCEIPLKIIDENNEEILCVEDTGDQTIVVLSDLILKGKTTEGDEQRNDMLVSKKKKFKQ